MDSSDVEDWDSAADRAASLSKMELKEVMKLMEVAFSDSRYNGRCDLPGGVYVEEVDDADDGETE